MKTRLALLSFFMIIVLKINTTAQTSFSCYYREYCDWSNYLEKFINCRVLRQPR